MYFEDGSFLNSLSKLHLQNSYNKMLSVMLATLSGYERAVSSQSSRGKGRLFSRNHRGALGLGL